MFEPVHGSAPKYAGTGKPNPFGAILTMALLLEHLGEREEADRIEGAVRDCLEERRCTGDVGGSLTTSEAGEAVLEKFRAAPPRAGTEPSRFDKIGP
jgi:3-isopropylmalate dehydrogenase